MTDYTSPFQFSTANLEKAKQVIERYPAGRQKSAVLALLDLGQRQNGGWLSPEVMDYVAGFLNIPPIKIREIATFYTMFNLEPVAPFLVQVCTTTPCWLCGSDEILKVAREAAEAQPECFTVKEVECLGACIHAPVVQVNDLYYENLTPDTLVETLETLNGNRSKE